MADTHINAFFAEVEDKQQALAVAQSELKQAKDRLEAKKREVGYEEPVAPESQEQSDEDENDVAEPEDEVPSEEDIEALDDNDPHRRERRSKRK